MSERELTCQFHEELACLFCGEPVARRRHGHWAVFRCGTRGPDANGEYATGHTCDVTRFTREIERLRAENAEQRREIERLNGRVTYLTRRLADRYGAETCKKEELLAANKRLRQENAELRTNTNKGTT